MTLIAAIDPGKTGAIALLYPDMSLYIYDMPIFGKEVAGNALASIFKEFPPSHTYIESVNSFGMGRQSAFRTRKQNTNKPSEQGGYQWE